MGIVIDITHIVHTLKKNAKHAPLVDGKEHVLRAHAHERTSLYALISYSVKIYPHIAKITTHHENKEIDLSRASKSL